MVYMSEFMVQKEIRPNQSLERDALGHLMKEIQWKTLEQ